MKSKRTSATGGTFDLNTTSFLPAEEFRHVYKSNKKTIICVTDAKGNPEPDNRKVAEIRLDATDGFIPLWGEGVTLNWRFNKSFGSFFRDPSAAKDGIRKLLSESIDSWKDACPVRFREVKDAWDFEIAMHKVDCDNTGCVLAATFFPNTGQNTFYIYPTMLEQSYEEQKETMEHEIGHIFGLRHFFADIKEKRWKSELFGTNSPFSIMNYGEESKLTGKDIKDLRHLYQLVWSGQLKEINRTPIKKLFSYHMLKVS